MRSGVVLLSSMQGKYGTKDGSSYSASKWGILGLTKSAAMELGQYNITVDALIPGLADTPLTRSDGPTSFDHACSLGYEGMGLQLLQTEVTERFGDGGHSYDGGEDH